MAVLELQWGILEDFLRRIVPWRMKTRMEACERANSAAAVRFSPVQRGFHENRKPNLGPVLPDLMNPELDRCERFGTVRFGFFLVRTQTEPKFFLEVKKKVSTSQK